MSRKFLTWLKRQKDRDDIIGDLSGDFISDQRIRNVKFSCYRKLRAHLSVGNRDHAREALDEAWLEFKNNNRV